MSAWRASRATLSYGPGSPGVHNTACFLAQGAIPENRTLRQAEKNASREGTALRTLRPSAVVGCLVQYGKIVYEARLYDK